MIVRKLGLALLFSLLIGAAAKAEEKPVLTIYTYDAFAAEWGPGPLLKAGFEKNCACTLHWVATQSSIGALRRVQLEGDTSSADIVLGLDSSTVDQARATTLFTEHRVDTGTLNVPNDWQSPDFVPFDYGYFAFVYNKEKLPYPPGSLAELAADNSDLKIVIQDPRSSTPGLGLVLWIKAVFGDAATDIWTKIAPHIVTVTAGWSESYNLFLSGEADMVLSYTTSPAYHLIAEADDRYAAAMFLEGHYSQIEVAGILRSSPNQQLANDFLTYLISPAAQAHIAVTNWMYPVADIDLPDGFTRPVATNATLLMDDHRVGRNSRVWIEDMLGALDQR